MSKQKSFSQLEKKFLRQFREEVNNAENLSDLRNHFSYTITNLLVQALDAYDIGISEEDIKFDPESDNHYEISKNLKNNKYFQQTCKQSDLINVIDRFADTAYHHYIHINKHTERTNKKIRN